MGTRRLIIGLAVPLFGIALGVVAVEIGLRAFGPSLAASRWVGPDRMYYIYTDGGLGKCYPSDPHGYFPINLRDPDDYQRMQERIGDVAGLPDEWSLEQRIELLRKEAPYCNDIRLVPLNRGPQPERPLQVLIIGDSFGFGEGLRLRDSIGFRLADLVSAANFANMSWPGASIKTIFDVSKLPSGTDLVLYLYNLNDVLMTPELDNRQYELFGVYRPEEAEAADSESTPCRLSAICQLLRERERRIAKSESVIQLYRDLYFSEANREPLRRTFERMQWMREQVEGHGAEFVMAVYPLFYRPPLADYPFTEIHELIEREARQRGIRVIDLLPAYDGYVFWDRLTVHPLDRHPSPEAIEVAAEFLSEPLTEVLAESSE